MTIEEFKNKYEQMKDSNIYKNYCSVLENKDLILRKTLKEKQELIEYLKEKIKLCDKNIEIHKKEIAGVVNISENNRHILLIKRFKVEKQIYEETLSKLVEIDQIEKR